MLGMQEVILILAILLLVFGPSKIPKIARELGKAMNEFNKASQGAIEAVKSEVAANGGLPTESLVDIAKELDLTTEGKTDQLLTDEILAKIINSKKD